LARGVLGLLFLIRLRLFNKAAPSQAKPKARLIGLAVVRGHRFSVRKTGGAGERLLQ
jgi:hypothetical protein